MMEEEIMSISLRLDSELENELSKYAKLLGSSKSELIRTLIQDFINKKKNKKSPWELGKDFFGQVGSGREDLSVNRKAILKEKLNAKKNRH